MFHPQGPTFRELMIQALSSTEKGYDLLAPKFEFTPFRTPDPVLEVVSRHLLALGPFESGCDLCCGTGAAMRMLRPFCRMRVVGLDISAGMLAEARRQSEDMPGSAAVEFVRGDVLALPFAAAFDVAVCFGALGHIPEEQQLRFVREVARALRPGGQFVFVTSHRPPLWSGRYWSRRVFNGVMRLRNWLIQPPFVMYYLTFLLPGVKTLLEAEGFTVEVQAAEFPVPFRDLRLVIATRPS
jgi:SAM-dependent methyltransferase